MIRVCFHRNKPSIAYVLFLGIISIWGCQNPKGTSLSSAAIVLSQPDREASCLSFALDPKGNLLLCWGEIDSLGQPCLKFAQWDVNEEVFRQPGSIPLEVGAALHHEGMPRLAFRGERTMVALYETHTPSPGTSVRDPGP